MFAMPVHTGTVSVASSTSAAVESDSRVPKPSGNQSAPKPSCSISAAAARISAAGASAKAEDQMPTRPSGGSALRPHAP